MYQVVFTSLCSATPGGGYPDPLSVFCINRVLGVCQLCAKLETLRSLHCLNRYSVCELTQCRLQTITLAKRTVVPLYSTVAAYGIHSSAAEPEAEPLIALPTKRRPNRNAFLNGHIRIKSGYGYIIHGFIPFFLAAKLSRCHRYI